MFRLMNSKKGDNMRTLKSILFLTMALFLISSCVLIDQDDNELTAGCYRASIPDPYSPDPNPPVTEFYIQFWDDGTGEGGFWADTLTESEFFKWELAGDTITFAETFYMFTDAEYTFHQTDSGKCVIVDMNDGSTVSFTLSDETVSRVDFSRDQIIGTWQNNRGQTFTFGDNDSLSFSYMSSTTWEKSDIPHVIDVGYGAKWAVRMLGDDMVIMAGYKNILFKQ